MPRFYFDSHDGILFTHDDDGQNFADKHAAKEAAASFVGGLSCSVSERVLDGQRVEVWVMVRDEYGRNLTKVSATFEMNDHISH